jgi:protein SCO1/2
METVVCRTNSIFPACLKILALSLSLSLLNVEHSLANVDPATVETKVGFDEHLGSEINLDLPFINDAGQTVTLRSAMVENRPFLLAPVYYSCPHLCTLTLNGITTLLKEIKLKLGKDFSVLAYTIKPEENFELAQKKRANYLKELGEVEGKGNWRFLSGSSESISELSKQIGFRYEKDGPEYAHTAATLIITPDGHISKYLYGVMYDPELARKALVDASEGRIGTVGERMFLYCFRYDHLSGQYTLLVMNFTNVVCTVFAVLILGWLSFMKLRESRQVEVA